MKMAAKMMAVFFIVLGALLCGCTAKQQPTPEPETLTMIALDNSGGYLQKAVDAFNADNVFNVKIMLSVYSMDDYKKQLSLAAAADDMPDLFFTWEAGFLEPYVRNGNVLSLSDYLSDKDGWGNQFEDGVFAPLTFDGEIYGVPLQQSMAVVFYNRNVFQAAEISVPETWDEFLDVCRILKERQVIPLSVGFSEWEAGQLLTAVMAGTGGTELCNSIANHIWLDEEMTRGTETFGGLYAQGYLSHHDVPMELLLQERCAMTFTGDWVASRLWDFPEIGAFLMPAVDPAHRGICIRSVDQCYAISSSCANAEAATAFLKYLTGEEMQRELLQQTGQRGTMIGLDSYLEHDIQIQINQLNKQATQSVLWIDRGASGNVGAAFNQMAMAILSGRDWQEELEKFRLVMQ